MSPEHKVMVRRGARGVTVTVSSALLSAVVALAGSHYVNGQPPQTIAPKAAAVAPEELTQVKDDIRKDLRAIDSRVARVEGLLEVLVKSGR